MADPALSVLTSGAAIAAGFMAFRKAREQGLGGLPKLLLAAFGVTLVWCAALFAARALMHSSGPVLAQVGMITVAALAGTIVGTGIGLLAKRG